MSMELFTCIFFISTVSEILGYSDIFFLIIRLEDGGAVFAFHGQWEWRNVSGVKFAGTSGYQTNKGVCMLPNEIQDVSKQTDSSKPRKCLYDLFENIS